jgi:hydrogenase maturation protein HypF
LEDPGYSFAAIQHHEAHIAACLVDNGWQLGDSPVIGVAWDGTGYGHDGHIWGGEFFVGDYGGFRRAAHLEYLPVPGGEAAILNPWRLAFGYVLGLTGREIQPPGVSREATSIVRQQIERGLNTPLTSAAGRLFDAVSALIGIRQQVTYEAQAAIEMEMAASRWSASVTQSKSPQSYPFDLENGDDGIIIRLSPFIEGILQDLADGLDPAEIGWRFHNSLADMIATVCGQIAGETGLQAVALSGGCFQNRLLLALVLPLLERHGFHTLLHQQVPCNDGGISLGQAALAHYAPKVREGNHEVH